MGAIFAGAGGSDIAGRIIGWLMISDPPEQSLAEIQTAVGASKASVSTMTRMLVEAGFIERAAGSDVRRLAFRVREDAWSTVMQRRFGFLARLLEAGERARHSLRGAPAERRRRLDEMIDFYTFMGEELTGMLDRWRRYRDRGKRATAKRS
jgi:DNA-binding transcriptional regulator GbsR (MarR family)